MVTLSVAEITKICEENGYKFPRWIEGVGWCALFRYGFNWSVLTVITSEGIQLRYCYEKYSEALKDLQTWDGVGDPSGDWIKAKGSGRDDMNPRFMTDFDRAQAEHDKARALW